MSEEKEQGEDKQKGSDEFEFYFAFTKPLVLDLPSSEDRAIAAAWVQKLEAEPESEGEKVQRLNYLKLLLFVLQRGRLSGIFKKQPPSGPLQPFPQGFSILDMGNWMLDQDDVQPFGGGDARSVPYTMELSNDLREFVAAQEIPNFGIQMYYAWSSDEPIHKWTSFDEEKFPQFILEKIRQLKETRSDEKGLLDNDYLGRKICDMAMSGKSSKRKVKTPQEIERAQGRSFHTYMGLVRRTGNFNEKCDDDPEKFQRPGPSGGRYVKRNFQRRCPGNRGEAENMPPEAFNNLGAGVGGINLPFRPCYCPYPCHHQDCPEYIPRGGPQPNEEQLLSNRPMRYTVRGERSNVQSPEAVIQTAPPGVCAEEQLQEDELRPGMQQGVSRGASRSRSGSPSRPKLPAGPNCPPGGNLGPQWKQNEVCICSSPPCTCPCPRATVMKRTQSGNTEGPCPEPPGTYTKSPEKYRGRGPGTYLTSFKAPESFTPAMSRPDVTPVGGRTDAGTALRLNRPEVVHCYDNRNPDPTLTEKIDKQWMTTRRGYKYLDTDYKAFLSRGQLVASGERGQCQVKSRRELFCPQAESTPKEEYAAPEAGRSPLLRDPTCEYSPENDQQPNSSRVNQQGGYGQQQGPQVYVECEGEAAARARSPERILNENYTNKSPGNRPCSPTQTANKPKSPPPCNPTSSFAVQKDSGRLADIHGVLQGLKQRTEVLNERCEPGVVQRAPPNDPSCYPGSSPNRTQTKSRPQTAFDDGGPLSNCQNDFNQMRNVRPPAQYYSPQIRRKQPYSSCRETGYSSLLNPLPNRPITFNTQQQVQQQNLMRGISGPSAGVGAECYQEEEQNLDECETDNEQEEDCDDESSESVDGCPPAPQCSPKDIRYKPAGPISEPLQGLKFASPAAKKSFQEGKGACNPLNNEAMPFNECGIGMSGVIGPNLGSQNNGLGSRQSNLANINWNPREVPPLGQFGASTKRHSCAEGVFGWGSTRQAVERMARIRPQELSCPEGGINWFPPRQSPGRPARMPMGESSAPRPRWSAQNQAACEQQEQLRTCDEDPLFSQPQNAPPVSRIYRPQTVNPGQQYQAEFCDNQVQEIDDMQMPEMQGYGQQGLVHPDAAGAVMGEEDPYMGDENQDCAPQHYSLEQPEMNRNFFGQENCEVQIISIRSQTGNKYMDSSLNDSFIPEEFYHSTLKTNDDEMSPDIEEHFSSDVSEIHLC